MVDFSSIEFEHASQVDSCVPSADYDGVHIYRGCHHVSRLFYGKTMREAVTATDKRRVDLRGGVFKVKGCMLCVHVANPASKSSAEFRLLWTLNKKKCFVGR